MTGVMRLKLGGGEVATAESCAEEDWNGRRGEGEVAEAQARARVGVSNSES